MCLAFLAGCGVAPVERSLPMGHPANPESPGTAWAPPPDPFKGEVPSSPPPGGGAAQPSSKDGDPAAGKPYPLDTCVVSGEKLGSMGKPVVLKYQGREVRLCCGNCEQEFRKDPAKYLKKLDEAEKAKAPEKPPEKKEEHHMHESGGKP